MLTVKTRLFPAVLAGLLGVSIANARHSGCYTSASLQGSYALVGTYGANVALVLGARHFDGNGNLTGTFVINEPTPGSTTGERTIVTGSQTGTYTVNCNGSGAIERALTLADGSTASGSDDFIIAGAVEKEGTLIATTIVDAQREPSAVVPGGVFLTRTLTRRPNTGHMCFTPASLQGSRSRLKPCRLSFLTRNGNSAIWTNRPLTRTKSEAAPGGSHRKPSAATSRRLWT